MFIYILMRKEEGMSVAVAINGENCAQQHLLYVFVLHELWATTLNKQDYGIFLVLKNTTN